MIRKLDEGDIPVTCVAMPTMSCWIPLSLRGRFCLRPTAGGSVRSATGAQTEQEAKDRQHHHQPEEQRVCQQVPDKEQGTQERRARLGIARLR